MTFIERRFNTVRGADRVARRLAHENPGVTFWYVWGHINGGYITSNPDAARFGYQAIKNGGGTK